MRKSVPLLLLLLFVQQVHANIVQGNYRWRNNDGSETTATWKNDENTGIANVGSADVLRLRFDLYNSQSYPSQSTYTIQLWYNDGTASRQVTTSSTGAFMLAQSNTTLTNGQATTAQLYGSGPFVPGKVITSSDDAEIYIPASSRTECEWVIKPGTDLLTTRTYTFEVRGTYVVTPTGPAATLATTGTLPLKLLLFTARLVDKKAALQWATAAEGNVLHFEVEKSIDGSQYSAIGTVAATAGSGTKIYRYTDAGIPGTSNYYRLKMVDKDGKFSYSNISHVRTGGSKNSIRVYPNPARDRLNISITAEEGEVNVALQDASGRTIRTFTIQSDGSEINKVADISTLQKGIILSRSTNNPFVL